MLIQEAVDFFERIPPFQFLDANALNEVAHDVSMVFFPKDTAILHQGGPPSEHLYVIRKGSVKVFIESDNNEQKLVDYRGEGDCIGFLSLFGSAKAGANVITLEDTTCYLIRREIVRRLLDCHAEVRDYFHKSFLTKYIDKTFRERHGSVSLYGGGDRILFTTAVGEIATKNVATASQEVTIQQASQVMSKMKISSIVLTDEEGFPVGIVTDRDLRDKVVSKARHVDEPIKNVMSLPLIRADAKEYCFEAILKMIKYGIHHLLVIRDGELDGIITNHDFMLLQGSSPLSLVKDIESQHHIEGLIPLSVRINNIVGTFLSEGAKASNIARVITQMNDRLIQKIISIAEQNIGQASVPYCWIVFGSEGRKEQTFRTDQDNALIYADITDPAKKRETRDYFLTLTEFVKEGLLKCGFPLCPEGFMASTQKWCQPLSIWKKYFTEWISTPTPQTILNPITFFDFRPVFGEARLSESLRDFVVYLVKDQKIFLGNIANVAVKNRPPLGFLKAFVVEKSGEHKDKLNLKAKGLAPIVDLVRLFALEKGVREISTLDRIDELRDKHADIKEYADELVHAFEFIMYLRIHHQYAQVREGKEPDNFINPNILSNLERKTLKESFHLITKIQDLIIERYKHVVQEVQTEKSRGLRSELVTGKR